MSNLAIFTLHEMLARGRAESVTRSEARGGASPTTAPAGGNIDACSFFERDYNVLVGRHRSSLSWDITIPFNNRQALTAAMERLENNIEQMLPLWEAYFTGRSRFK